MGSVMEYQKLEDRYILDTPENILSNKITAVIAKIEVC